MKKSKHAKKRQKQRKVTNQQVKNTLKKGKLVFETSDLSKRMIKYQNVTIITNEFEDELITTYKNGDKEKSVNLGKVLNFPKIAEPILKETTIYDVMDENQVEHDDDEVVISFEDYMNMGKKKAS